MIESSASRPSSTTRGLLWFGVLHSVFNSNLFSLLLPKDESRDIKSILQGFVDVNLYGNSCVISCDGKCSFLWYYLTTTFFSCPRRFIIIRVYERRRFSVTPRVVFHIDDMRFVSTSFFAFLRSSRLRRSPPFFSPCYCFFPLWDFFFCEIKLNQLPVTPNKCFRCFQVLEDLMIHAYKLRDTNRTTKWLY